MKNSRFSTKLVGNNRSYEFSLRVTALMEFRHDDWYVIFIVTGCTVEKRSDDI